MICVKCGREAFISTTTEAIELGFGVLVVRNIPCYKCEECDEIFYTGDVVKKLEQITYNFHNRVGLYKTQQLQGSRKHSSINR